MSMRAAAVDPPGPFVRRTMRSFQDQDGRRWLAAVGKESYGTLVILFSREGDGEVLRGLLGASTRIAAESELAALGEDDLRSRLAEAEALRRAAQAPRREEDGRADESG